MKKYLLITLLLIISIMLSCSKDSVSSGDLSGTTWKHTYVDDSWDEYILLKFKTKTTLEFWYKPFNYPLEKDGDGIYSIDGSKITIDDGTYSASGTIDKKTISFVQSGELYTFVKQ